MTRSIFLRAGTTPVFLMASTIAAEASSLPSFLFSDQSEDAVVLVQDTNADGDGQDPGEATIFFDENNASGLVTPTSNVFTLEQDRSGTVYVGDGNTDAVYAVRDKNGDSDAQDAGEAQVWFSAAGNADGRSLLTPNGLAVGNDGAIYITEADVISTQSGDFIYRTEDLNNDGDAQDLGESSIWLDLKALDPASSAFEIAFDGDVAYVIDSAGGSPRIYRAEDTSNDGSIDINTEVTTYIDDTNAFGVGFFFAMDVALGSVFVADFGVITQLTDLNGSGTIDQANEAVEVWDETLMPLSNPNGFNFGLAANDEGDLLMVSNGGTTSDLVVYLSDTNDNGLFSADETTVAISRDQNGTFPNRARTALFYDAPAPVSVPPALPLLAGALGVMGVLRRRPRP
ncbi:MAG: hypothetical protein AAGF94_09465 [Pseudomonadota bacterium]